MSREEKILLITNGTFCVGSLLLLMYLPDNAAFTISDWVHALLYVPPFGCFMLFLKKRKNLKAAIVITWVCCAVMFACALLFGIAALYSTGGVMIGNRF